MAQSNVTLLYGNDEFAMKRRLSEFASIFSDPSSAEMNTARLDARTMSDNDLNNAVNSMPFLAKQRLVTLSNPSARYSTPQTRKKFCEFIEKVPPTARVVITEQVELKYRKTKADQEKEDDKHWLVKWMRKTGLGLERCALPAQWQMNDWIIQQAREQGGQMEPGAAAKLAEMVGPDTRQASQEIAKLLTYVNWTRPVKMEDVQAASIVTAEADIFKMVDALAAGNGHIAGRLLHSLLENEDAFALWPMVVRQFRLMLLARELIESQGSPRELAEAQHVPDFAAEKAFEQARRFSMPVLEKIYHKLLEIDEAAKTGRMPLSIAMEMLVAELS
jgi:DNA polymerase III subunit delta